MTYVRDEAVKNFLGQEGFEIEQKGEALFVRNLGKGVIRIFALEVDDQLGEFMIFPESFNRVSKVVPADNGRKVSIWLAMPVWNLLVCA